MTVVFLVPDIHHLPTGGNVYNRRVIDALRASGADVNVVVWPLDASPADPALPPDDASPDAVVVDSLLVRHEAALRRVRRAQPKTPLVLLAHGLACLDPQRRDSDLAASERAVLDVFDGGVAPSAFARDALVDQGLPAGTVHAVPPGLDDAFRAPVPEREPASPPHVVTVASLVPGKGLPALVRVLDRLASTPWTAEVVGNDALDPQFADRVRDRLAASGVSDRVTLAGPVDEDAMPAVYDRANVFALPSRFETCNMATREAMTRGLPVVAFAVGGLPENLGDAPAGRLVPPGDVDAFERALRDVLTDADARRRMGRAARTRSRRFPSWPDVAQHVRDALAAIADRTVPSSA